MQVCINIKIFLIQKKFMKLSRKNKQIKYKYSENLSENPSIPVIHLLRHFSNLRNPSDAFARHVRNNRPPQSQTKNRIRGTCPNQVGARIFTVVRVSVCVREKSRKRETCDAGNTEHRRAVRRVSWNEKTRSTNFLDALDWSIDVDFEWAGTRNFTRERGPGGWRGRLNS